MTEKLRYHGLDLARAVLMSLGVIYHSALVYEQDSSWRISVENGSEFLNYFSSFLTTFRMEAFYIIAGFFYGLVYCKYGYKKIISIRLLRLIIPLVVIGFTFNFIMNMLSLNRTYSLNPLVYIIDGQWLGHLWFIGNLIVYYIVAILFTSKLYGFKPTSEKLNFQIMILVCFTVISAAILPAFGKFLPEAFVFITFKSLLYYLPFFMMGVVFHWHQKLFAHILKLKVVTLFLIISILVEKLAIYLDLASVNYHVNFIVITHYSTWLALFILALFNLMNRKSAIVNKFVDSSFTIYLLHQPFILMIFPLMSFFSPSIWVGFTVMWVSVFLMCYISHYYIINKSDKLLLVFNGVLLKSSK